MAIIGYNETFVNEDGTTTQTNPIWGRVAGPPLVVNKGYMFNIIGKACSCGWSNCYQYKANASYTLVRTSYVQRPMKMGPMKPPITSF